MDEIAGVPDSGSDLQAVQEAFASFLANNPASKIVASENPAFVACILNPWDDESLALDILVDHADLAEALNNLYLPWRYSAIWHRDTKSLEVIWTTFTLPSTWKDIPGREFVFSFKGIDYNCHFTTSSNRLLTIALSFRPISSSGINFRNLVPYRFHMVDKPREIEAGNLAPDTSPLSFWIKGVEWNDDEILVLINHVNFYLKYYDAISPTVLVHSAKESEPSSPQTRFSFGDFPKHIDGREVDDVLLTLWEASLKGDPARKFLYCYRIIEYASFYYLDSKTKNEVRKILATPHARSDISSITEQVIDSLQKSKLEDFQRCEALLVETVKPSFLWREIKANLDSFKSVTKFDGGFDLKPLVSGDATESTFEARGMENFHRSIRELRNALSHGKDTKSAGVITPTSGNFSKLTPWVSLISVAAAQVMLFKNLL